MGDKSKIEWTDATWNPVTGCTKVSQGCKNCYAETWANRKMGNFSGDRKFTDIICHEDRLEIPLKWNKPRKVFVNSMSDLFHEKVPFSFIDDMFAVMSLCKQHNFQILTKRPERMKEYLNRDKHFILLETDRLRCKMGWQFTEKDFAIEFPLPNVWLGVSVEDQKTADERIPILLKTPASVRWVSAEPLLGEIYISKWNTYTLDERQIPIEVFSALDWIVVGGESGHKARPMHPDWVRKIRDDCKAAEVPFFFKQWGEYVYSYSCGEFSPVKVGKSVAGNYLDDRQHLEFPKSIQCVGVCTEEKDLPLKRRH